MAAGTSATPPRKSKSGFDIYCNETRPVLLANNADAAAGNDDLELKLAVGWRELDDERKNDFVRRYEQIKKGAASDKTPTAAPKQAVFDGESQPASTAPTVDDPDEDIEMGEDKPEPAPPAEAAGGFTAVNRG